MKKLQPLRVPAGWTISYNHFHECDASDPDSDDYLIEDLYQAFNEQHDQLLDIGWYGSMEEGSFGLTLVQHDFRGPELAKYNSRNRQEIVLMAEEWMANPDSTPATRNELQNRQTGGIGPGKEETPPPPLSAESVH